MEDGTRRIAQSGRFAVDANGVDAKTNTTSLASPGRRVFPSRNLAFLLVDSRGGYAQRLRAIDSEGGARCWLLFDSGCAYAADRHRCRRRGRLRVLSAIIGRFCAMDLLPD
jgi:hypothetical protein